MSFFKRHGVLALLCAWAFSLQADSTTNSVVRLQGQVTSAGGSGTNLVFKTDSESYQLVRNKMSEALFLDTNLFSHVLLLAGKVQEKSFEVTKNLRSVKDGQVYELVYYCNVCSISSSLPGLCQCCRDPYVLMERPVE